MNLIKQYGGLRRENYILFIGRIVTNMGAMVWPILTFILNKKLGLNATQIAFVDILSGLIFLPIGLIGGAFADRFNKKMVIVYCDTISIIFYIICAFIPISYVTIVLIVAAAAFQNMENPSYNALIADITGSKDRERAYSLSYLGAHIGLVASPILAGFMFKKYLWLSFLISGFAIGLSTVLIFFGIKDITPIEENDESSKYQKSKDDASVFKILWDNKIIILYVLIMGLYWCAYGQYGTLMPLDLGRVHGGDKGAIIYGSVSSLNCIVVVIFTPIFTKIFAKLTHTKMNLLGELLLVIGYAVFLLMLGHIPFYYVAITLFTFGEILTTISNGPYLTLRIPQSHRGRVNGFMTIVQGLLSGIVILVTGRLYDLEGSTVAWIFILSILTIAVIGSIVLIFWDKKKYSALYTSEESLNE